MEVEHLDTLQQARFSLAKEGENLVTEVHAPEILPRTHVGWELLQSLEILDELVFSELSCSIDSPQNHKFVLDSDHLVSDPEPQPPFPFLESLLLQIQQQKFVVSHFTGKPSPHEHQLVLGSLNYH